MSTAAANPPALPTPRVHLDDEVAPLKRCIIFRPGGELERLLPRHIESSLQDHATGELRVNPDYLLFDDLVLTGALCDEHRAFRAVLSAAVGEQNLLDLRLLLQRLLWPVEFRKQVIDAVLTLERELFGAPLPHVGDVLEKLAPAELTTALISGAVAATGQQVLHWPMPNWLFARDCFAIAGNAVVLGYPRHPARRRDGLLARAIVRYHPEFAGADIIDVRADTNEDQRFFEGGDLLLPAPGIALIGIGIRTSLAGANELARQLKARGFRHVLGVKLPLRRGAMHLDTIFTMLDASTCLQFSEAFAEDSLAQDRVAVVDLLDGGRALGCDLVAALGQLGVALTAILCGGGDPIAARREQWTDGANAVCLGPGRALLYARNEYSIRALNEAGFEVLQPAEFVRNAALLMTGDRRFVVALSGFELSRGRGGPRCLTLPIARF